jgi:hypothetical protein
MSESRKTGWAVAVAARRMRGASGIRLAELGGDVGIALRDRDAGRSASPRLASMAVRALALEQGSDVRAWVLRTLANTSATRWS